MKISEILFSLIFIGTGITLFYLGGTKAYTGIKHMVDGVDTTAKIFDIDYEKYKKPTTAGRAIIQKPVAVYSVNAVDYSTTNIEEGHGIGDEVIVTYLPETPGNAIEKSLKMYWLGASLRFLLGIVLFTIGAGLFIYSKKK